MRLRLGLSFTVRVRARAREQSFSVLFFYFLGVCVSVLRHLGKCTTGFSSNCLHTLSNLAADEVALSIARKVSVLFPACAKNGGVPGTHCLRMRLIFLRCGDSGLFSDSSVSCDVRVWTRYSEPVRITYTHRNSDFQQAISQRLATLSTVLQTFKSPLSLCTHEIR